MKIPKAKPLADLPPSIPPAPKDPRPVPGGPSPKNPAWTPTQQ